MEHALRTSLVTAFGVLIIGLFAFPKVAHADGVVISNGFVRIGGAPFSLNAWSAVGFNFSAEGFSASGGAGDSDRQGIMSSCAFDPCQPGATISPNSTAFLDGFGAATFNGMTIPAWWLGRDSVLSFTGPGVVIPSSTDSIITVTSPFVMSGSVVIRPLEGVVHPPIFSTMISGSGIATM